MFEVISSIPQSQDERITFDVRMETGLAQAFQLNPSRKEIHKITFMDLAQIFPCKKKRTVFTEESVVLGTIQINLFIQDGKIMARATS